jgi:hypothetical protein
VGEAAACPATPAPGGARTVVAIGFSTSPALDGDFPVWIALPPQPSKRGARSSGLLAAEPNRDYVEIVDPVEVVDVDGVER